MGNENASQPHDWSRVITLVHYSYTPEKNPSKKQKKNFEFFSSNIFSFWSYISFSLELHHLFIRIIAHVRRHFHVILHIYGKFVGNQLL